VKSREVHAGSILLRSPSLLRVTSHRLPPFHHSNLFSFSSPPKLGSIPAPYLSLDRVVPRLVLSS